MFAAGVFLISAACAPRTPEASVSQQTESAEAPAITLERTACFGACPVYRLWATEDGKVGYEGKAHVRHLGPGSSEISRDRLQALLSELDRAGYFSFADRYAPAEAECGRYSTDSPSAITSLRWQGRIKRVVHDYGCGNAPGALVVLERRIDEVLGSAQWTGR
jgi:hypothetical protein